MRKGSFKGVVCWCAKGQPGFRVDAISVCKPAEHTAGSRAHIWAARHGTARQQLASSLAHLSEGVSARDRPSRHHVAVIVLACA